MSSNRAKYASDVRKVIADDNADTQPKDGTGAIRIA